MGRQETLIDLNTGTAPKLWRFTLSNRHFGDLVLQYAPDGWADDEYQLIRDMKRFGIFRKFAQLELKFVKDGRDYIQECYEGLGINADVGIKVEHYTQDGYVTRFEGKIDFSTYKISELSVDVQIYDGTFTSLLMNRMDTVVDIVSTKSIENVDLGSCIIDPILIPELAIRAYAYFENGNITETDSHMLPITKTWYNFSESATQGETLADPDSGFFKNSLDDYDGVSISFSIGLNLVPNKIYDFDIVIDRYNGGVLTETVYQQNHYSESGSTGGVYNFADTVLIDIATGDYLLAWILDNTAHNPAFNYRTILFKLDQENEYIPTSYANGVLYRECFNRLVAHYTGYVNRINSSYLAEHSSSEGECGCVLTARMLTGTWVDITLPISLSELFDALSVYNIGIGVDNISGDDTLIIEPMEYFFSPYVILDLSSRINEKTIVKSVIPELYANQIKIGYNAYDYSRVGGVYDPNTERSYTVPVKAVKSDFILSSPFRADTTGIITILQEYSADANYKPGDDTYLLQTFYNGSLLEVQRDENYDNVTSQSLIGTDLFNLDITPARILRRWGSYIRSMLYNSAVVNLKCTSTDTATDLSTKRTDEDETIVESEDVKSSTLSPGLWIPEAYTVEYPIEDSDIVAIEANKYGIVKLSDTKYGWILSLKTNNSNRKAQIRLLRVDLDNVAPIPYMPLGFGKLYNFYAVEDARGLIRPGTSSEKLTIKNGYLYNWYALNNENGFAPDGWHVPTAAEWATLQTTLGGYDVCGGKMKETGTTYWLTPNTGATNTSGLSMRGAGIRLNTGVYSYITSEARYHSSDNYIPGNLYGMTLSYNSDDGLQFYPGSDIPAMKRQGHSVRLIKDDSNNTGIMIGNDGTVYPTVKVGNQVWMAVNSIETKYRSLDPIPERTDAGEWTVDAQGSRCSYDNDEDNAFIIEPTEYGWHVPTIDDFLELFAYLGGTPVSGGKLKETGFNHWNYPNTGATNEVLFSARGAGKRTDLGVFEEIMKYTALWSQDETYVPEIVNDSESVNIESYVKTVGLSVRACRWTKLHHGATGWYVGNDGQQYRTVVINTIEWMTENLKETKYANGDTIPEVTDAGDWEDLITGAWCYYDNKLANQ